VLLDREVIGRLSGQLAARDFYQDRHALIYQTMLDLDARGEPVDYLTIITELERTGRLSDAGTATYVASLIGAVPSPIHAERYATLVADTALMRRLISAGGRIATIGFQNQLDPQTAIARCEQLLAEVDAGALADEYVTMVGGLQTYMEQFQTTSERDRSVIETTFKIPTTYRDVDRILGGGFARGDLVLLAGRPGMGKSSLGLEIITRAAIAFRAPTVLFSLEMSAQQVLARMVSATSGVPLSVLDGAVLLPGQERALGTALGRLAECDVLISEAPTLSLAQLRSQVRRRAARSDLALVVVDHIQLVSAEGENRVAEMGQISRGLKALARDHNVVVLALSQLSRAVEQRADKIPVLSDLRESGSLEQDADVVLMLHREEYYKPQTDRVGVVDLYVRKHRNGRTGDVALIWNGETTGFRGLETFDGSS